MGASYHVCGVVLDSDLALPTLSLADQGSDDPRVELRRGSREDDPWEHAYDVPAAPGSAQVFLSVSRSPGRYLVRVHGHADFVIEGRCERILYEPRGDDDPASLEQLLVDQILARGLQLRGRPPFHASAVELAPNRVIALVGPSGSGKSTLSARLGRDAPLVCDDCLVAEIAEDHVVARAGYPSLRLWPDSARALAEGELPLATPRTQKRRLALPMGGGRLRAMVVLAPGDEPAPRLSSLGLAEAVGALIGCLHRLEPGDPELLRAELDWLADVVERVDVARLSYRHDYAALDEVVALLQRRYGEDVPEADDGVA